MSEESLSQNQVESLLKAMETVEGGPPKPQTPKFSNEKSPTAGVVSSPNLVGTSSRVTAYDFKRPERVGKDQMRAIHSLHEALARNFGASVSVFCAVSGRRMRTTRS